LIVPVRRAKPAAKEPARLDQDLDGEVDGTAALEQLDRQVEVDTGGSGEHGGVTRLVSGPLELLRAPPFDAIELGLGWELDVGCGHLYLSS
jgi:hypothetical protein